MFKNCTILTQKEAEEIKDYCISIQRSLDYIIANNETNRINYCTDQILSIINSNNN